MIKVLFFGQGTGGNALVWFNYFNDHTNAALQNVAIEMLCRTPCDLDHSFKVFKPFGRKKRSKFIMAFRNKFLLPLYIRYLSRRTYELLFLQGNYTPENNLKLIKGIKCKSSAINIYGSDFISDWFNRYKETEGKSGNYYQVLHEVDNIYINWKSTYNLFLKEFPEFKSKTVLAPWGVSEEWIKEGPSRLPDSMGIESSILNGMNFLSTRALHSYNNVDLVVEAFCQAFPNPSPHNLKIISAYGCDDRVLKKIKRVVADNNMHERVSLEVDCWYEGSDLVSLYDEADFNICFGDYDQLTISIVYAFLRRTRNILSPIESYHELKSFDFKSPIISSDLSVESLVETLLSIDSEQLSLHTEALINDQLRAKEVFNMNKTFDLYLRRGSE